MSEIKEPILEVYDVTKNFGDHEVLRGVNSKRCNLHHRGFRFRKNDDASVPEHAGDTDIRKHLL